MVLLMLGKMLSKIRRLADGCNSPIRSVCLSLTSGSLTQSITPMHSSLRFLCVLGVSASQIMIFFNAEIADLSTILRIADS